MSHCWIVLLYLLPIHLAGKSQNDNLDIECPSSSSVIFFLITFLLPDSSGRVLYQLCGIALSIL
uniref:Uncharacterized protein n=1 Tax=Anguilla anguilla TaxID=7936 RepID=A0A0E9RL91_ANGAN